MRIQGRKKSGKLGCESIENSENCARGIGNSWQQWQWNVLSSPHNLWVTIPRWKTHLCKVKCKTVKGATDSLTCRPVYCSVKQGCRKKVTYSAQNFTRRNKYSNSHGLAVMDNFNYIWPHKFAERLWALPGSCIHCPGASTEGMQSTPGLVLVWFGGVC